MENTTLFKNRRRVIIDIDSLKFILTEAWNENPLDKSTAFRLARLQH